MGSGKRNYSAMRKNYNRLKWKNTGRKEITKTEKKEIKKEDFDNLIRLWEEKTAKDVKKQ